MKKTICAFAILFMGYFCMAQKTFLWTGVEVNIKVAKHLETKIGYEYRRDNIIGFNKSLATVQITYEIVPGIKTLIKYRNAVFPNTYSALDLKKNSFSNRFSCGLNISFLELFNAKSKRLVIQWTGQQQWENFKFQRNRSILRNKFQIKYDIKNFKLSPYASTELFYSWNRDIIYGSSAISIERGMNSFRHFIGFEVELSKRQSLDLGFGFREQYLDKTKSNIIRATYKVNLN
jgi:hypothetical protein